MSNLPLISIITISYNQDQYLEECIQSVITQDYPNIEYIIIDGGSEDKSSEIIRRYEKYLYYWQSEKDNGQSSAINCGMNKATGDILCWLNSDDKFSSDALKIVGQYFHDNASCEWLAGSSIVFSGTKQFSIIKPGKLDFETLCNWKENIIAQPSVFWKRALWEKVNGVDETLDMCMDFDLWLKFSQVISGDIVSETLSYTRFHKKMKTHMRLYDSFVEQCLVLARYGREDLAKKRLSRVVKRAFEIDNIFSFITRNPLYRWWRERNI